MKFNIKDLNYLTNLAKLELTEEEKNLYLKQLSEIISFVEKLQKAKTETITFKTGKIKNTRADLVKATDPEAIDGIISQFSEKSNNLLKTPLIFARK